MNVDTTSPITHVSLCAGYGGIDLGLKRAIPSLRTIAFSEIEAFACANLVSKMEAGLLDPAPIWTDLKTFPWSEFHGCVDILSGGYPCQPFSAAGKRLGAEDPRHLWPHISAGIAAMRPSVCFFENVEGHISLGLPDVLQDLAGMGYRTTFCVASASEVGAPHQRKRIFILAECRSQRGAAGLSRSLAGHEGFAGIADDCGGEGCGELADAGSNEQLSRSRRNLVNDTIQSAQCYDGSWHSAAAMANPQAGQQDANHQGTHGQACCQAWPSRPGEQQYEWEPPRVVVGDASNSGHAGQARSGGECSQRQPAGHVAESNGAMGHTNGTRPQVWPRQRGSAIQGADADGGEDAGGKIKSSMGDVSHGTGSRVCGSAVPGLSDQELAEIREWMVTSTNRTDSLRLLGNGVVPATAERAFRVLLGELMEATT